MGDEAVEFGGADSPGRWRGIVTWSGLLTASFVVYEVTNQPALGTAVMCLKFGWQDFKTARWLWRYDPWRARGRACWWMFVAWGLWKVAALAVGVNIVVLSAMAVIENLNGKLPPDRLWGAFIGAGLTSIAGLELSAVATVWALIAAARNRTRLWLDGSARRSRLQGHWPPYVSSRRPFNRLRILHPSAGIALVIFGAGGVVGHAMRPFGFSEQWRVGVTLCFWLAGGALMKWLKLRVLANTPDECWPPDELAAAPDDPLQ
jgi:hypothetical protein